MASAGDGRVGHNFLVVFDFGIAGYQPGWLNGINEVANRHGRRLRGLVGRRLTGTWVVWDADDDEWFR